MALTRWGSDVLRRPKVVLNTEVQLLQLAIPPGAEEAAVDDDEGLMGIGPRAQATSSRLRGGCWFEAGNLAS